MPFSACNRSTAVKPSEEEKNTASRPALQTQSSRLSAPVQTLAGGATHVVAASGPAPKADTTPPKVVVSDHIQDLPVAQLAAQHLHLAQRLVALDDLGERLASRLVDPAVCSMILLGQPGVVIISEGDEREQSGGPFRRWEDAQRYDR